MEKGPLEKFTKEETIKLRKHYIGGSCTLFFKSDPLKIVRGEGQYMYDEFGRQYLDCINNVAHVGHCHSHVVQKGAEQMSLLYTNNRYLHDNIVEYARRLTSYFPNKLSVCFFVNSGSEANDLALRLARNYTKHKDVIVIDDAYHGHLTSTTDLSPYKFKKISGGHKKWVHVADLPCSYRGKYTKNEYSEEEIGKLYANDIRDLINQVHNRGRNIAAFIAESMISCGGQVILPKNYLRNVYRYVREAGGICIADEVQTGFGRVGKSMWAFELQGSDIVPDIVTLGKPIGNGHPVAAVVTTPEIAKSFEEIGVGYFNTYGGNPVSLAVANAVLDVIENESLMSHATNVGNYLLKSFKDMMKRQSIIGDVRGEGLFIGIELVKDKKTKEPATDEAKYVISRLKEELIIMSTDGIYENVLKFKPPMVFSIDNAKHLLTNLETILTELYEIKSDDSISLYEETSTDEELSSPDL
ncbi:5-phosphohydroxy-L-lysine phospho-lyase-like isoform X2 [Centruroides sculpturatus]|uniref:5-phosphohydroxy-L-lysine phospho-lyase-like isoform X2 n=1 Tax=Centruroides sculpturatus TaxID=218467 RepID=UPI000C6CC5D4|nr:5-phosphohydroxy-L-lysine phospho-lyase-like isoform X2 [Centruroides sculpturatus]